MRPFLALALLASAAITRADGFDTWSGASPDKHLLAIERRLADPAETSRRDLDGCSVFIYSFDHGIQHAVIAQHSFPGRVVSQMRWSPDSQFLLFTTASSGGHSPWNFQTYAFCVADKSFRDVQEAAHATVGAADFRFESPDIAVLIVNVVPAESVKEMRLPLGLAAKQMERLPLSPPKHLAMQPTVGRRTLAHDLCKERVISLTLRRDRR